MMIIKKQIVLALSTLLLSTGAATAREKPEAFPNKNLILTAPALVTSTPTLTNQERDELERLRQENLIRDRVQSEVDHTFRHSTILLNSLLFILILLPIATPICFWLLRRIIIYQITSENKILLEQMRERCEKQLAAEIRSELQEKTKAFQQEITTIRSDNITQLSNLISEAQTILEDLRQQKDVVEQEIDRLRYEHNSETQNIVERDVESLNNYDLSELLDIGSDEPFEFGVANEKLESASSNKVWDANDYLQQGNDLFLSGRYGEANNAYSEAIKLNRNFPEARYQNARCYGIRGKLNLAIGNLQWAIDLDHKYKEIAENDSAFDAIRENEQFKKTIEDSLF